MGGSGGERTDDRGDNNSKDTFPVDFCSQVIKYNEHNSYQVQRHSVFDSVYVHVLQYCTLRC